MTKNILSTISYFVLSFLCFTSHLKADDMGAKRNKNIKTCALIITDDDIPSGSATAGAMYVKDAELGKKLLTGDVVAVAKGFLEAGASCVDVIDSHDGAIDPEPLKKIKVPVLTPSNTKPWTWPFIGPMTKKYNVAALQGFHSNAGARGFRPHTINDSIKGLEINGEVVGEVAHMIIGLAAFNVPVVMISGDVNAVNEARDFIPEVETIPVRWLGPKGEVQFLSSAEAEKKLQEAAKRGFQKKIDLYHPKKPFEISLQTNSSDLMSALGKSIPLKYLADLKESGIDKTSIDDFAFGPTIKITADKLSWRAPGELSAFVSIAFAANHLKGGDNWNMVHEGYKAFEAGEYNKAVEAYRKALKQNPYDTPTRCRLAAALHKQKKTEEAFTLLESAVSQIYEFGDDPMKSWCWMELAEVARELGKIELAKKAAEEVLKLPDIGSRHDRANKIL